MMATTISESRITLLYKQSKLVYIYSRTRISAVDQKLMLTATLTVAFRPESQGTITFDEISDNFGVCSV